MDKILRAALAAIEAVRGQAYPVIADKTASGAYIVYKQKKNTPLSALDGSTGCSIVIYDIFCVAEKYSIGQGLAGSVAAACASCVGVHNDIDVQTVDIIDQSPMEWSQPHNAYVSVVSISCFIYQE